MAARTLLCFGDSNTHGTPGDDQDKLLDDLHGYAFAADGSSPLIVLVSPIHLDPAQPGFAEAVDYDAGSVAMSRALASAYNDIAERRGLVFFDAATVARSGADAVHLTVDSHAALARALAGVIATAAT